MTLVVLSGRPGVGKSTLARALAQRTGAIWLRIDSLEAGFAASEAAPVDLADAGYRAAVSIAADNLALGQSVIADAVNGWPTAWGWWSLVAAEAKAPFLRVRLVADPEVHRLRVEARHEEDPDAPDWASVQSREVADWPEAQIHDVTQGIEATLDALAAAMAATATSS